MSDVILTDIIQTVLETSESFLSKSTNNMHILGSGPEWQAVYSGHAFHPDMKILPPTPKKITRFWLLHDMCYFIVFMSSLLFYNVKNIKK